MQIIVDGTAAGRRVDAIVGRAIGVSAAAARRLIAEGLVRVDHRAAVKGARVVQGALIEIAAGAEPAAGILADDDAAAACAVVYQDADLIAIDKPAGMPSHPLKPGERGCAANGIVTRFPECAVASPDPREGGLAHRLDTATSGVLVAARSRAVWTELRRALGADDCEKRYLCEVWGAPPDAGRIDAEIGRRGRRGGSVRIDGGRRPRSAETTWTVVGRGVSTTLVEARLHAGRPHQVRAHLAAAGYPIVGDDRYGEARDPPQTESPRNPQNPPTGAAVASGSGLHLHAASVRFRHPGTGAALLITAPTPQWAKPDAVG